MRKSVISGCALASLLVSGAAHAAPIFELEDVVRPPTTGANTFNLGTNSSTITYSDDPSAELEYSRSGSGYSYFVINFPEVTLEDVGDRISLSFAYTPSGDSIFHNGSEALRIGLFDNGGTALSADASGDSSSNLGNDTGYVAVYSPRATPSASSIFRQRTGSSNNLFSSGSYTNVTGSPTLDSPGTGDATGTFSLERVATGITLTSVINGGTAQSVTDLDGLTTTFNQLGIFFQSAGSGTLTFTDLTVSFVPEPGALSLLGLGGLLALRRRRAT